MKPDENGMYFWPCRVCGKDCPSIVDPDTYHIDGHYCSAECRRQAKELIHAIIDNTMTGEIHAMILPPCNREGGKNDWWKEKHIYCTGTHHIDSDRFLRCTCSCHVLTPVPILSGTVYAVVDTK